MRKPEVMRRILQGQLRVEIHPSQWGLVGKIYDLEQQGFQVSIIPLQDSRKIEKYRKQHDCNAFFEIRAHDDQKISSDYNPETIRSYLTKAKIENPEKIDSSDIGWFFEKQGICGYFLGDDIPF